MNFNIKNLINNHKSLSNNESSEIINNLRFFSIHNILENKTNQINIALQSMPFMYVLFKNFLTFTKDGKKNFLSDNLVVGKNYGSVFLKSILFAINEFKNNENINDVKLPNTFYDFADESACKSLSFATGLALSQKLINKNFLKNKFVNKTYCVLSQEELSFGSFYEILSFAGHQEINSLICIVDFSGFDSNGFITNHTSVDYQELIESLGWDYYTINDGSNLNLINKTLNKAQSSFKPVFIAVNTILGHGLSTAGTVESLSDTLNFKSLETVHERFEYTKPINQLLDITKKDLISSLDQRISARKSYYDSFSKDKDFEYFFLLENSECKNLFYKNCDLIKTLITANKLNLIFLLNGSRKVQENLLQTNQLIACGKRYSVINDVICGIKSFNFFNPILITDFYWLSSFYTFLKNDFLSKNSFHIFLIDELNQLPNNVDLLNLLHIKNVNNLFFNDVSGLNEYWNNWNTNNEWNICFLAENCFDIETYESKMLVNESNLNVLTQGLSSKELDDISFYLKQKNVKFNLISIKNSHLFDEEKKLDLNIPLLLINISPNDAINNKLLNIKNKNYLVKFSDNDLKIMCEKIFSSQEV